MVLTWNDARTKVRGDLWRSGTSGIPDDVCDRALHASLLELEQARRFLWLENVTQTVELVAAAAVFDAPANLRSINSIAQIRTDGTMDDALSLQTLGRIRILASQLPSNTYASNYALGNGKIYLDGVVPLGTQFEIVGTFGTPEDMDTAIAAAGTNVTLTKHQAIVIPGACADVALGFMKNEAEAARHRALFDRRLARLTDREDEQRSDIYGGLAVPDTYYQDAAGH